jgi:hypothetical protein
MGPLTETVRLLQKAEQPPFPSWHLRPALRPSSGRRRPGAAASGRTRSGQHGRPSATPPRPEKQKKTDCVAGRVAPSQTGDKADGCLAVPFCRPRCRTRLGLVALPAQDLYVCVHVARRRALGRGRTRPSFSRFCRLDARRRPQGGPSAGRAARAVRRADGRGQGTGRLALVGPRRPKRATAKRAEGRLPWLPYRYGPAAASGFPPRRWAHVGGRRPCVGRGCVSGSTAGGGAVALHARQERVVREEGGHTLQRFVSTVWGSSCADAALVEGTPVISAVPSRFV